MDFELSREQAALRDDTRAFAEATLRPGAGERERAHAIPHEVMRELGRRGLLGVNLPKALGGSERGVVAYAVALREIARVDAAVAVTMAVTNMVGEVLHRFGTDAHKARYIPKLTSGEYYGGAFALSEPSAGSDAGALQTRAVKDGSTWRLTGQKMWISHGDAAGIFVVWARTGGEGTRGISCFLIEAGQKGLSAGKPEEKMGLIASHTVALSLEDVCVPEAALLGELGRGFAIAMTALDGGRIGIGAQSLGLGSAALSLAKAHVKASQFDGAPMSEAQAYQWKLADLATELDAAWLLTLRAAHLKERGEAFSTEAAMAKVFASETANRVVRETVQIIGSQGPLESAGAARLLRDARVTQIYEGTSEVQRVVISRAAL